MDKTKKDTYIRKLEMPVWQARMNNGKGSKVFPGDERAEEMLSSGFFMFKVCKAGDLR